MSNLLKSKFERVMIIDDNFTDLYISSRIIVQNDFGKEVLKYTSASAALKFLLDNQNDITRLPEVIFVDIYMPLMSGFEFLEHYNTLSQKFKNKCQLFVLSSTIEDSDILRAHTDKNVVQFLVKPVTKELLNRIKI